MSGWHPNTPDGAIPPNPNDLNNPAMAYAPARPPLNTAALYYGNACDVRLRPHVLNSLISENLAVVDRVGLGYDISKLTNLREGIEYIVQRGLPKHAIVGVGPNYYNGVLDPPCTQHNNGQVVVIVPTRTNRGFVRLNLGAGQVPVLRNDMRELEAEDWRENVPEILGYYNGAWYMLGLCASQVPIVLKGSIDFWIRPDGNDATADGMANTPDRAFRTIDGCWQAVGSRYAASPTSHIALKLGVPGDYEAGTIGPYGAIVSIYGDSDNRSAYRILMDKKNTSGAISLTVQKCNYAYVGGVNLVFDNPTPKPNGSYAAYLASSNVLFDRVQITLECDNIHGHCIGSLSGNTLWGQNWTRPTAGTDIRIFGNNHTIACGLLCHVQGNSVGSSWGQPPSLWYWNDINLYPGGAFYAARFNSGIHHVNQLVIPTNCNGSRYQSTHMSTIQVYGSPPPGNLPGSIGPFSTYD